MHRVCHASVFCSLHLSRLTQKKLSVVVSHTDYGKNNLCQLNDLCWKRNYLLRATTFVDCATNRSQFLINLFFCLLIVWLKTNRVLRLLAIEKKHNLKVWMAFEIRIRMSIFNFQTGTRYSKCKIWNSSKDACLRWTRALIRRAKY